MGLSGNQSDVRFDFDGSLRLARSLWAYAEELDAGRGDRRDDAATALRSWRGRFGEEFRDRANDEQSALATIVAALRTEADSWAAAWKAATDEQNRRLYARRVEQMKEERSFLEKAGDYFTGFDYPPPPPPVPKPAPPGFYAT